MQQAVLPPADPPDHESYALFLGRKEQISAWLRAGYSVKGVWKACRRADPPFEGSYQTFWRYCRQHGLIVPRGAVASAPPTLPEPGAKAAPAVAASSAPKVWPRITGKPREFIPKVEE